MDKLDFAAEFVEDLPNHAARTMETLRAEAVSVFVDEIPDPQSSKALRYMLPHHAAACLQALSVESSVRYLVPLPISNSAMILRHLAPPKQQEIIDRLPKNAARRIRLLLKFPRTVVGSWTNVDAVALPKECTVAEALRRVRENAGDAPGEVFIVDQDHQLIGKVWIGTLAASAADKRLDEFLTPVAHTLSATASIPTALGDAGWKDADILPVVDRSELFFGTVRYRVLRQALLGVVAEQPAAEGGTVVSGLAGAWFSGMATILEAILVETSQRGARP